MSMFNFVEPASVCRDITDNLPFWILYFAVAPFKQYGVTRVSDAIDRNDGQANVQSMQCIRQGYWSYFVPVRDINFDIASANGKELPLIGSVYWVRWNGVICSESMLIGWHVAWCPWVIKLKFRAVVVAYITGCLVHRFFIVTFSDLFYGCPCFDACSLRGV